MNWRHSDREDAALYKVVVSQEEQYSIWPEYMGNPLGWKDVGKIGPKPECLAYIREVWTDMRPLSLRKKMEETAKSPPPPSNPNSLREKSLVDRLCEGEHPVEVGLHPERTVLRFREAIDCNYMHIKFTNTRGGTELSFRLDCEACDFEEADFESRTGKAHIEGELTLDYVKVRCIADIDLSALEGKGHLMKAAEEAGD
jgi:uncharacterized protein YbdZ (MbtH family)